MRADEDARWQERWKPDEAGPDRPAERGTGLRPGPIEHEHERGNDRARVGPLRGPYTPRVIARLAVEADRGYATGDRRGSEPGEDMRNEKRGGDCRLTPA